MILDTREFIYIVSDSLLTSLFSVSNSFVMGEYMLDYCIFKETHIDYGDTSFQNMRKLKLPVVQW